MQKYVKSNGLELGQNVLWRELRSTCDRLDMTGWLRELIVKRSGEVAMDNGKQPEEI